MESPTADLEEFVAAAHAFIAWVDEERATDLRMLHRLLARVQQTVVSLSHPSDPGDGDEPADDRPAYDVVRRRLAGLPLDSYAVVFDALEPGDVEPVKAALSDDLADIYHDILDGFRYLDAGNAARAIRQWRWGYYAHWGRHLVHAQCAIWQHLANDGDA